MDSLMPSMLPLVCGLTAAMTVLFALASRPTSLDRLERYVAGGRPGLSPQARLTPWKAVIVEALAPRLERHLPDTYLRGLRGRLRRAGLHRNGHYQAFLAIQAALAVALALVGLTLGGGAEFTLHADHVVASAELYMGLVEVGVGLIP
ncbi:MAG: hypothetical protein ACK46X_20895, partial [Candidatus Sericytochromatia bacterium]